MDAYVRDYPDRPAQTPQKMQRQERERIARLERERIAQLERERIERLERERIERLERERIARLEQERIARLEQERIARLEQERIARLEQERIARETLHQGHVGDHETNANSTSGRCACRKLTKAVCKTTPGCKWTIGAGCRVDASSNNRMP
jgi:hypothetical protein